jgi:hypothetical protein
MLFNGPRISPWLSSAPNGRHLRRIWLLILLLTTVVDTPLIRRKTITNLSKWDYVSMNVLREVKGIQNFSDAGYYSANWIMLYTGSNSM